MKLNIWKVGHNLFCSDSSNLYVSMGRITKRNFNIIQHFTVVTLFHETSSVKLKISYSLQLNVIHNSKVFKQKIENNKKHNSLH